MTAKEGPLPPPDTADKPALAAGARIAVVGAGVAGLSAAWMLRDRFDVTVFEAEAVAGGHAHSVTVAVGPHARPVTVDLGFVVFNDRNYPLLRALFWSIGVEWQDTDMSFSYSQRLDDGRTGLEYAGSDLNTLFAQRANLLRPGFWRMAGDILRFNRLCKRLDAEGRLDGTPLAQFLDRHRFGRAVRDHYLLPMTAAIWSCPAQIAERFPIDRFVSFFRNHGLLDLTGRPQWHTVVGGSQRYVARLCADLGPRLRTRHRVRAVARVGARWQLHVECRDDAQSRAQTIDGFDAVILATHADTSRAILDAGNTPRPSAIENVAFSFNRAVLHSDPRLMPRTRRAWSSWNYLAYPQHEREGRPLAVTYWMNRLHRLDETTPVLLSLNPVEAPADERVLLEREWSHPVFDAATAGVPQRLRAEQDRDGLFIAGAWTGFGFHEDGLRSAVQIVRLLGVEPEFLSGSASNPPDASDLASPTHAPPNPRVQANRNIA